MRLLCCFLVLLSAAVTFAQQRAPELVASTEPLTAAEQLKKFHLPPGFEIQLVASEPDIRKPINLAFDDVGRLYATQSEEYPFEAPEGRPHRDVVKRFDQFAADGRAQKVSTVVSGLNIPIGIAPVGNELIVFSIPNIYRCRDLDGDGVYEERTVLYTGFGHRDTHGMVNNITPWIDGWIYCCHGFSNTSEVQGADGHKITMQSGNTFRILADGSRIEYYTHGQVNPFGLAFDPLGNFYTSDCHTLPAYQLLRGAWYPSFGKPHDGLGFAPTIMSHNHGSTGIAGIVYYAADHFPPELQGTLFIGNPVTGKINHDRLDANGSTLKAIEQPDFVTCNDPWFRPVDLKLGPDGAIYIADFYNRIIGHYEVPLTHPQRDRERGRIWRIVYRGQDGKHPAPAMQSVATDSFDELIELLGHPRFAVRIAATNRLARDRMTENKLQLLRKVLAQSDNADARAHAMWVLERTIMGGLDEATISRLADDPADVVQVQTMKLLAERSDGDRFSSSLVEVLRKNLTDTSAPIRRAAADALGRHPRTENVEPLLTAWSAADANDTHLVHTIRMAVRDHLLVPAIFEETAKLAASNPSHANRIANVSLGAPTPAAAAFLLAHLEDQPPNGPPEGAYLEHAIRYASDDLLPPAIEFAEEYRSHALDDQLAVARATHRALQARGAKLPESLRDWELKLGRELLATDQERRVQAGLDLARDLKRPELHDHLLAIAGPGSRFPGLRSAAIDACVANDAGRSVTLLSTILQSSAESVALRQKAAQALGNVNSDTSRQELLAQLKTAPERLAVEIAASLSNSRDGAELLLASAAEGKTSAWLLQEAAVQNRLRNAKLDNLDERLKKLTAGLPPPDERLRKLVQTRRDGFAKVKPDATLGKVVFTKTCAACHKLASEGNKIGPELDGVAHRGLDRLLEDVLDPNRNVDQAFRATQIVTTDGRSILGLALRREGQVQVLADAQGKEVRIPVSDIEEQSVSLLSPMPANVADIVPEVDFYHLVAFLLQQKQTPMKK